MAKHLLAIIGLIFAGLAIWPAWSDGATVTATTAGAPGRAIEDHRLAGGRSAPPPACREPANPPLARSLLGLLGLAPAEAPRGRQPGPRPCVCTAAASALKTGPGHLQEWIR